MKYKCTYTSHEGVRCPIMFKFKHPHPDHCHAYDTSIWDINPNKTCKDCVKLRKGEKSKKKIWCDEMPFCDTYNDGGEENCMSCPCVIVVFQGDLK